MLPHSPRRHWPATACAAAPPTWAGPFKTWRRTERLLARMHLDTLHDGNDNVLSSHSLVNEAPPHHASLHVTTTPTPASYQRSVQADDEEDGVKSSILDDSGASSSVSV